MDKKSSSPDGSSPDLLPTPLLRLEPWNAVGRGCLAGLVWRASGVKQYLSNSSNS